MVAMALPLLAMFWRRSDATMPSVRRTNRALLATGALLFTVPALVLWPVTGHVLNPEVVSPLFNQRFFALASVGAALLSAAALANTTVRAPVGIALGFVVLASADASINQSSSWASQSAVQHALFTEEARATIARIDKLTPSTESCLLDIHGSKLDANFSAPILKSLLPHRSPWLNCTVFVDGKAPYYDIASIGSCLDESIAPAKLKRGGAIEFGGACLRTYDAPAEADDDPRRIVIDLGGGAE